MAKPQPLQFSYNTTIHVKSIPDGLTCLFPGTESLAGERSKMKSRHGSDK